METSPPVLFQFGASHHTAPLAVRETLDSIGRAQRGEIRDEVRYWAPANVHRHQLLTRLLSRGKLEAAQ